MACAINFPVNCTVGLGTMGTGSTAERIRDEVLEGDMNLSLGAGIGIWVGMVRRGAGDFPDITDCGAVGRLGLTATGKGIQRGGCRLNLMLGQYVRIGSN